MIEKNTSHYKVVFYENFVIAEALEGVSVNNEVIKDSLKVIFDHFGGQDFTLISHRKNNYSVNIDVYTAKLMKKVKALAIVSSDSVMKKKALAEQMAFDQSFAFFDNLEDAISWAENKQFSSRGAL